MRYLVFTLKSIYNKHVVNDNISYLNVTIKRINWIVLISRRIVSFQWEMNVRRLRDNLYGAINSKLFYRVRDSLNRIFLFLPFFSYVSQSFMHVNNSLTKIIKHMGLIPVIVLDNVLVRIVSSNVPYR